jgi:hypothetical protein
MFGELGGAVQHSLSSRESRPTTGQPLRITTLHQLNSALTLSRRNGTHTHLLRKGWTRTRQAHRSPARHDTTVSYSDVVSNHNISKASCILTHTVPSSKCRHTCSQHSTLSATPPACSIASPARPAKPHPRTFSPRSAACRTHNGRLSAS